MDAWYDAVQELVVESGERIRHKAGSIADLGAFVTEEDRRIERELKDLIRGFGPDHALYAEEENRSWPEEPHVWVADPISGTQTFLQGLPHYAIAVALRSDGCPRFAVVLDPSMAELFTARAGQGAFCNGRKIEVSSPGPTQGLRVVLNLSSGWKDERASSALYRALSLHRPYRNTSSFAVNYCHVACGRYDGVVTYAKDAFPELVSELIVCEAGGVLEPLDRTGRVEHLDRRFVGGSPSIAVALRAAAPGSPPLERRWREERE